MHRKGRPGGIEELRAQYRAEHVKPWAETRMSDEALTDKTLAKVARLEAQLEAAQARCAALEDNTREASRLLENARRQLLNMQQKMAQASANTTDDREWVRLGGVHDGLMYANKVLAELPPALSDTRAVAERWEAEVWNRAIEAAAQIVRDSFVWNVALDRIRALKRDVISEEK